MMELRNKKTINCNIKKHIKINKLDLNEFKNDLNIQVIKGLSSACRPSFYHAKVVISNELYLYLIQEYGLKYSQQINESFMDNFHILRAFFKNVQNYSKILEGTFKVGVRKGREAVYKTFYEGKLVNNTISPRPIVCFSFFREDIVVDKSFFKK